MFYSLIEYETYSKYLEGEKSPLRKETRAKIKEKGYKKTADFLLEEINRWAADIPEIFRVLQIKDISADPKLSRENVKKFLLNRPNSRQDLKRALVLANSISLANLREWVKELLVIVDFMDYDQFVRNKAIKNPGLKKIFVNDGALKAAQSMRDDQTLGIYDVQAISLQSGLTGKFTAQDLLKTKLFNKPENDEDIEPYICDINSLEKAAAFNYQFWCPAFDPGDGHQ